VNGLANAAPLPATSFDAHYRLVAIHPFGDGNGRAARLSMNLLLLREGYPPVAVRPEDRKTYPDTLEQASVRDDLKPFQTFMHQQLDADLGGVLERLARGASPGTYTRQTERPRPQTVTLHAQQR
jgi:Fic family protein